MKITFVCQWYPPEPADVPRGIAAALSEQGHAVTVLTGIPNYPTGVVADGYRASSLRSERVDGVVLKRTPLYPSHDSSAAKRMLNYASWALSSSVFGQRSLRDSDAVLVYSSPATAALSAMVAKRLWGTPYVLLVQDVWPDSIFASGFLPGRAGSVIRGLVNRFVQLSYAWADHVAVISPGMATLLESRGVPTDRLSVVYNWVPEESVQSDGRPDAPSLVNAVGAPEDARLFLYAGNHGHAQALETLIEAFRDERTDAAHLVMLGDGVTKGDLVVRADGHPRIHFLDPVPRQQAAALLGAADVSIVSLADEPLFSVTMPSKVQAGLATATPLLVVAAGDAARAVNEPGAGASAQPGDVESIVQAVRSLSQVPRDQLREMGQRGQAHYLKTMSRAVGALRLSEILTDAAQRRRFRRGGSTSAAAAPRKDHP